MNFNDVWEKGDYRRGSTALRMIPFLQKFIPQGSVINDYGSGTGRADVELIKLGYKVNMVDFADVALEDEAKGLIGENLTYTVSDLSELPEEFPVANWGICINVLMTVEPDKLDKIMLEMKRTCKNLIIEVYDRPDVRLGKDRTLIKGNANFWLTEMTKYWTILESYPGECQGRYIVVGYSSWESVNE
ncbi:MAG: class I SAM-dependent methyltransferase [Patescibacteria group bacterium]